MLMVFIPFGLFFSCKENTNHTVDTTESEKEARQMIFLLGSTPDSLRSPEQKALVKKLERIVYEHCQIKNDRFEVTLNKKEFKTMGVPEIYYDILKKDIEDINHYLDTTTSTVETVDVFKKTVDEYFTAKEKLHLE
jgi:hypothetical protein